jgi:aspartyl-tRNA(Asn)/glutamyl-tRNA(Gln) amidotransferase subunit B
MRIDTNISLEGGARVEIKNINSIKGAYRALKFEIMRQKRLMERGVEVKRETRAYLESQMITKSMRGKETAEDYRYIPDPDIPPLVITEERISRIKQTMPEAPHLKLRRFVEQYGIPRDDAWAITSEIEMADAFEKAASIYPNPKEVASFFRHIVRKVLSYNDVPFASSNLTAEAIAEVLKLRREGKITDSGAEMVIRTIVGEGKSVGEIVKGLERIAEAGVIEETVRSVVEENPKAVADYRAGRREALNFLMGQVMRKTRGRADPKLARKKLVELLEDET